MKRIIMLCLALQCTVAAADTRRSASYDHEFRAGRTPFRTSRDWQDINEVCSALQAGARTQIERIAADDKGFLASETEVRTEILRWWRPGQRRIPGRSGYECWIRLMSKNPAYVFAVSTSENFDQDSQCTQRKEEIAQQPNLVLARTYSGQSLFGKKWCYVYYVQLLKGAPDKGRRGD